MTTLQEPLPCPFCGSKHVGHTKLDYREFVICNRCGAGADSADTAPEKTALEVWNTRPALAQQGEPVCADCGIPAGDVHMSTCKSGKWPSRVSNGNTAAPQAHPSRDVTELAEALEKLARLGNGEHYGNSDGNMIARTALSKYKGAK